MAVGQVLIAGADATPDLAVLAAAMVLQGVGVGLFQVAYFDIVTASIPRADRGVAGSLVMMTRTLGTVTGATVLMLLSRPGVAPRRPTASPKCRLSSPASALRSAPLPCCRLPWWYWACCAAGAGSAPELPQCVQFSIRP